jgi:phospholipid transport system substrate-binding protein
MNHSQFSATGSRRLAGIGLGLLLAVGISAESAAIPANPQDSVRSLYQTLLATMKDARTLGESGRYARLAPVVGRVFDIPLMARLSIGPSWAGLSDAQRQKATQSYGRYISAVYADRFDSYNGQKFEVNGEQQAAYGVLVESQIIKANGDPVKVDYVMRRNANGWLISDIYLDSTISEVALRRSEFATILRSNGVDGLIAALDRKTDSLIRGMGRSS